MVKRKLAQKTAALSGSPDDIREAKNLRNRVVDSRRTDRKKWEHDKLTSTDKKPDEIWKGVKSVLGWGDSGPPTRLFHNGKMINSPKGLSTTMNNFFWNKVVNIRNKYTLCPDSRRTE